MLNRLGPLRKQKLKKLLPLFVLIFFIGLAIILIGRKLRGSTGSTSPVRKGTDNRVDISGAKASQTINQEFTFPVRGNNKTTVTEMKFTLENAELRDEIIVKGKRALAIKGRSFLILTVKITSNYTRALEINSKDFFRLSVNGNTTELLAPDIHNDPVVVQPTSTKYTRLGFPINDMDKDLTLIVGEIEGEKVNLVLTLK